MGDLKKESMKGQNLYLKIDGGFYRLGEVEEMTMATDPFAFRKKGFVTFDMSNTYPSYFRDNGMPPEVKWTFNDNAARHYYIYDVKFNPPATIVWWSDNTKTVVKTASDEPFDKEKGLAMAIAKKFMGNKGNYYNEFKKWIKEE